MNAQREQLAVAGPAEIQSAAEHGTYRVTLIRAGTWPSKALTCPPSVLAAAVPLFAGRPSFLNPPPPQPGGHGYPDLRDYIGMIEEPQWDETAQAVTATLRLASTPAGRMIAPLLDDYIADRAAGRAVPDIGLSAVLWLSATSPAEPHSGPLQGATREIAQIYACDQVDAVYRPAAGGSFDEVLAAQQPEHQLFAQEITPMSDNLIPTAPLAEPPTALAADPAAVLLEEQRTVLAQLRDNLLDMRLAASNLPAHLQSLARESLRPGWTTADLESTITRIQAAWSQDEARRTVRGVGPISMTTGLDQVTEAMAALVEGRRPAHGIAPLSGLREAYLLLSGDHEMTGMFDAERVHLANVNSTTMANIVANVLNKAIVAEFQNFPRWWAPIVRTEQFSTLQTVKWIVLGGLGELPVVSEGAAYTELTWDDASETTAWQKRGGYLGLTLEAMDKDETARLRTAPRAIAQAAWLTLGKSVSSIFTAASGVGPTLADSKALFHTDHANLGTTALNTTSWPAAKLAMRKQAEVNSGERLGALTSPRYLLVPPDLENTAITILSSENMPGHANNDVNPEASGNTYDARRDAARRRIIVVDLWTDTSDWAAVADPQLYPTIGLGFRYGEVPELFSVASPTSGLMFTNDVMPVKARWFYAVGPMDYRGLYKANVA